MADTARVDAAVVDEAVVDVSDMPDTSGDSFEWEGTCWEAVTDPDLLVATMDPAAPSAAKEALVVRQVQTMDLSTKKLIVTDETILNHATLIGQTVVDDINVQGKLIGRDGVFTGTVDFENVNVTGTQIVNKIEANSISASQIKGGSFSGETFTGGVFIGGVFSTATHPSSDGGVHIDPSNGIRGWDSDGQQTFQLEPINGTLRLAANGYYTNPDNRDGLVIVPQTRYGNSALFFSRNEALDSQQATIWRGSYTTARDQLMLRGGNGGGITVPGSGASSYIEGAFGVGGNVTLGSSSNPTIVYGGLKVHGTVSGFDNHLAVEKNFRASGNTITFDNLPTTSYPANLRSTPENGRLYVNTSSARYKRNIVNWNPSAERVLALRPRQWQHDDPNFPDEIDERWHVGFVAEEVDELGLKGLVDYVGDGKGGWIPQSLNYERFCAAQQVVLVDHESRITELEARIAELEEAGR